VPEYTVPHTSSCPLGPGHQRLGEESVEQPAARAFAGGQARLELIAERHQLIDSRNDSALLG